MPAPVCLIVNPSAGGGKARRVAPDVERALRGQGLEVRRVDTRDLDHARELAEQGARAGETVVVLSGDGLIGVVADVLRDFPGAVLGVLPGGRGNDLARVLGIPKDPIAACAVIARGVPRAMDLGEVAGQAFVGIASVGFDSVANRIANEAPAWLGNLVYAYGALRALASWRPARFEIELDPPGERLSFTAYTVGACNSKTYGGGMRAAPDAMLDDGLLEVVVLETVSKREFLTKLLPRVFKGTHVELPSVHVFRAAAVEISADRPFTMYADGDPIGELPVRVSTVGGAISVLVPIDVAAASSAFSSPHTVTAPTTALRRGRARAKRRAEQPSGSRLMAGPLAPKIALARAVGAVSRLRGGGASSAPGKVLMRLDPGAIGELSSRLSQGSVLVSATNGKTTTSALLAGILERAGVSLVNNQSGANMAGGIASTLLAAARPRGSIAGELGLFEVDELWLDSLAAELHPRAILLGNLFRDQLDRYGELETIADRWATAVRSGSAREATLVLNADDPAIADLGREREAPVAYFGVEDDSLALPGMAHAADAKHCRRCGAPYVFDAVYLGHLGHYHCPSCGQTRPTPTVIASSVTLQGVNSARFMLQTPAGVAEVALSLPGLYNVYNALAAAALATALDVGLPEIVAGLQETRAAFGRSETVHVDGPRDADPAREEPRGRQRGAAHARAGARRARPARSPQRQDRRRSRRFLDLGCRLRAARRAHSSRHLQRLACSRARAAPEVRGDRSGPHPRPGRPLQRPARGCGGSFRSADAAVRAADLHRDARPARVARRAGGGE